VRRGRDGWDWPVFDERRAATLCFTSGTTGNPKGVLYSHRSLVLACMRFLMGDQIGPSAYFGDVILATAPMFHANGWNLPWIAPMAGLKLVLPGRRYEPEQLTELMIEEGVNATSAVPTVWASLIEHWERTGRRPSTLRRVNVGGSAPSPDLLEKMEGDLGLEVFHGWGMTETSALGSSAGLRPSDLALPRGQRLALKGNQGRMGYGVEMRLADEAGATVPRDGITTGHLQVRGPWIAAEYFRGDGQATTPDGWLITGDIASIAPDGRLRITDRAKDVIKSGGEWISSLELERMARLHPAVADAAAIGIPHPRWMERPVLLVVPRPGHAVAEAEILAHIATIAAKWWVPERVLLVDALPLTGTGKVNKAELRKAYAALLSDVGAESGG
jgi:fatty-acyl-CoA synthase